MTDFVPGPKYTTAEMFKTMFNEEKEYKMKTTPKPPYPAKYMRCVIMDHAKDLPLPAHQTEDASGMDLYAAVNDDLVIQPGMSQMVPTGLCIEVFKGFEAQCRSRSGLAAKNNVFVLNSPGTIDADYRGEIKVILMNLGSDPFVITRGMRIAQLVVCPYQPVVLEVVDELSSTDRGSGGFGSTGV